MLFHDYTVSWWQMGLLKLALIALGILIGAQWPKVFKKPIVCWTLFILFLVIVVWQVIIFWPQI